jgi:hypothetical protein
MMRTSVDSANQALFFSAPGLTCPLGDPLAQAEIDTRHLDRSPTPCIQESRDPLKAHQNAEIEIDRPGPSFKPRIEEFASSLEGLEKKAKEAIPRFHYFMDNKNLHAPVSQALLLPTITKAVNQCYLGGTHRRIEEKLKLLEPQSKYSVSFDAPYRYICIEHKSTGSIAQLALFTDDGQALQPVLFFHGASNAAQYWDVMKQLLCAGDAECMHAAGELTSIVKESLEEEKDNISRFASLLRGSGQTGLNRLIVMGHSYGGAKAQYAAAANGIEDCVAVNSLELGSRYSGAAHNALIQKKTEIILLNQKGDFAKKFWMVRLISWIARCFMGLKPVRIGKEKKFKEGSHLGENICISNVKKRGGLPAAADPLANEAAALGWKEWRQGSKEHIRFPAPKKESVDAPLMPFIPAVQGERLRDHGDFLASCSTCNSTAATFNGR